MLQANVDRILAEIGPDDTVLDIGGWAQPFNRANYVVDVMPYETRGVFNHLGPDREYFTRDTWINHDVSSRKPLPFEDKQIDFVICSHVIEDVRDPLALCAEIVRVGKRGYLEAPSRVMESIMGIEGKRYPGYCHHRWLVEFGENEVDFRFKSMLLNESWRYHLPKTHLHRLREEDQVAYLFWNDSFECREILQMSFRKVAEEFEAFVRAQHGYPTWRYRTDDILRAAGQPKTTLKRLVIGRPGLKRLAERLLGHEISLAEPHPVWKRVEEVESR